jgi:hypothetical protein
MSTHYHHLSEDPATTVTTTTINQNPSAISAQQQQLRTGTANGQPVTTKRSYPSATASYEEVAQSSDIFWEKLKAFHNSFGTKFM